MVRSFGALLAVLILGCSVVAIMSPGLGYYTIDTCVIQGDPDDTYEQIAPWFVSICGIKANG